MLLSTKKLLSISLLNFNHLEILNKLLPKKLQFAVFLKTGDKKNVKYIKGFNKTYEFPFRTKFRVISQSVAPYQYLYAAIIFTSFLRSLLFSVSFGKTNWMKYTLEVVFLRKSKKVSFKLTITLSKKKRAQKRCFWCSFMF